MKHLMKTTALTLAVLAAGSTAFASERGGTMTYGRYADSLFLDPVLNDANVDIWILSNLYDTLLEPTDDGKGVEPGLAEEWKVADDGMTVTLTLRDGIKFSDGSPITTEDVKWSLERAAKPDNGIWGFLIESIDHVTAPDDKTVVIALKHPDPAIVPALHRLQYADHAGEGLRGHARRHRRRQGQGLRRASDRLRPLHVRSRGSAALR